MTVSSALFIKDEVFTSAVALTFRRRGIWESDRRQISDATESCRDKRISRRDVVLGDGGLRQEATGFGGISPMPCCWDLARCTRWAPGGRMSALSSPRLRTFRESPRSTVGFLRSPSRALFAGDEYRATIVVGSRRDALLRAANYKGTKRRTRHARDRSRFISRTFPRVYSPP